MSRQLFLSLLSTTALAVLSSTLIHAPARGQDHADSGDPTYNHVDIRVQDDIDLPAQVDGQLIRLTVREGSRVTKGQEIGRIDPRMAEAQLKVAEISLAAARERADDKIEEQYARKAADVARTDYKKSLQIVEQSPKAISEIELRRKKLDFERAALQILKAQKDQVLAGKEADVKVAEKEAAEMSLKQRIITAPFDGDVQRLYRRQSEWVNPGDPILQLMRLDKMMVEVLVDSKRFDPVDVAEKPVTLKILLARDRKESFQGRVFFVAQSVDGSGQYYVRAEVENRREGNYWLIRPGLHAEVIIHVSQPAKAVSQR